MKSYRQFRKKAVQSYNFQVGQKLYTVIGGKVEEVEVEKIGTDEDFYVIRPDLLREWIKGWDLCENREEAEKFLQSNE